MNYLGKLQYRELSGMGTDWTWIKEQFREPKDIKKRGSWFDDNKNRKEFSSTLRDLLSKSQTLFKKEGAILHCLRDFEHLVASDEALRLIYLKGSLLGDTFAWFSG